MTGCAGFIGSHLCARLLGEGFQVVGIDSLTEYYDPKIKLASLDAIKSHPNFEFIQADLVTMDVEPVAKQVGIIFHLAAQPGVRGSWGTNFDIYLRNNVAATQRLLECVKESNHLIKFVYASSSSVYGQIASIKVNEEHPTHPFSPYGVTKLAAENLCALYDRNYGVPCIALRFFTVYGPRQRPDMAFARLITAAFKGEEFSLYGDGSQERDFTYIEDILTGVILAGSSTETTRGVLNVGGGHVASLNQVITMIEELTGRNIQIVKRPHAKGDLQRTSADISKIGNLLGYTPKYDLYEGVQQQVLCFQRSF